MINVSQSFHRTSANAVDDTLTLTKAQMLTVNDNLMPAKYLTICQDDGFIYLYNKSATPNETTGKFTKFEGGSGVTNYNDLENRPQIEGITLTGNKTASDLGLAKANQIPTVPTKVSQLQNDSGFITSSALPGVYEGDTAGLVPSAGSDNEGKYLDNDGNWTTVPMPMIGTINRSDIYDTTEKVIGKWTDGRPLYQKTYNCGACPNGTISTTKSIEHGLTNFQIVGINGIGLLSNGGALPIPDCNNNLPTQAYSSTGNMHTQDLRVAVNATAIQLYSSIDRSSVTAYITLQYTKTTDAANSYNYADENDYSTSEKIIGKWIDGKTLYQKTITDTLPTDVTDGSYITKKVNMQISNLDKVVNIEGFLITVNNAFIPANGGVASHDTYYPFIVYVSASTNDLRLVINKTSLSGCTCYVTLKYTKTSS